MSPSAEGNIQLPTSTVILAGYGTFHLCRPFLQRDHVAMKLKNVYGTYGQWWQDGIQTLCLTL
jgi:hypothetical protein